MFSERVSFGIKTNRPNHSSTDAMKEADRHVGIAFI
jgi:hypothetical protein